MENEISNKYIESAINELEKIIGVKEPVLSENIFLSIKSGKAKEAIKLIAHQLGLPIDINITNVPDHYRANDGSNQFDSTHLVKVHQHGLGDEGITAQVTIPGNLPFYGSSLLDGYVINVKISANCIEHPVAFAMIMAHELSHVLLHSLSHPQKQNEFYTDLTAIMLGFKDVFKSGRKIIETDVEHDFIGTTTKTKTTTYGYLNDNQFNFAFSKINSILNKNRERKKLLSRELGKMTRLLLKYENVLYQFNVFLEFLIKNTNKKISGKDGKKMMAFFQPGYVDELGLPLKEYKEEQKRIQNFLKEFSHYTEPRINQLLIYIKDLKNYSNKLKPKLVSLGRDVGMLKKYVGYKYRAKIFFLLLKQNKK